MALEDLRVVVAVAEQGSFVGAARATRVPTSTVSRAVARFEDAVGVRLFTRTSRHVAVTDEGERLLARAAPLLDELDGVLDHAQSDASAVSGRLRVTAPIASGAGPIAAALQAFAAAHPQVTVELSLSNSVIDLVEEGFDLAFRGGPVAGADLIAKKLWSVEFVLAAAPAFVRRELGRRRTLDRRQLERLPAVATRPGETWRFLRADGVVTELRAPARFVVNDPRVAVESAQRGLGLVRAPRDTVDAAGLTVLTPDPELGALEGRDLYAVQPSRRLVPRRVRLAIEWVARSASLEPPPPAATARPTRR